MHERVRHANVWLWLTGPIAVLLAIAAGSGVFIRDLYRDAFVAQAVGQDLISLAVVLPTLIVTAVLAGRGSTRARLVWLGGLGYLVYTYVVAAFAYQFNPLFLVYVALLGCSLYALIGGLATADVAGIKAGFSEQTPIKAVSIFMAALGVLFYALWLSEILPALVAGAIPQSVREDGTPTDPIHVVDMAWILPAFGITAASLWRKQALGYTLAGATLSFFVLLVLAILGMIVFQARAGQPGVLPSAVLFGALFTVGLGMLLWYLKGLRPPPIPRMNTAPAGSS